MKKTSLFVGAGTLLLVAIVIYTFVQLRNVSMDYFAEYTLFREKQVLVYSEIALQMTQTGQYDKLESLLSKAIDLHMFDWYQISYLSEPVSFYPNGSELLKPNLMLGSSTSDQEISFITTELKPDTMITIGINKDPRVYGQKVLKRFWRATVQDMVLPVILALLVFFIFLKDILKFIKILTLNRSQRSLAIQNSGANSVEGQKLKAALEAYESQFESDQASLKFISEQMLPSLRHELQSGKKPPYEFNCTMARIDINHYSTLFQNKDRDLLAGLVHQIFAKASEVVARYKGYVYEFVGDEILFYFKDEDHPNPSLIAAACVRDIFAEADRMNEEFLAKMGQDLRLKASLANGLVRFGAMVNTHTLSGSILIETVRILSIVEEKNQHSLLFPERECLALSRISELEFFSEVKLKGSSSEQKIFQIKKFLSASEAQVLASSDPIVWSAFRSDSDLILIFPLLSGAKRQFSAENAEKLLFCLRGIHILDSNLKLAQAYCSFVKEIMLAETETNLLATALSLMPKFVDKDQVREEQTFILQKCLLSSDNRVISNALDLCVPLEFMPVDFERFLNIGNPRVRANMLNLIGKRNLGVQFVDALKLLVKDSITDSHWISLCYTMANLLEHWQNKDRVYLKAQTQFWEEFEKFQKAIPNNLATQDRINEVQKLATNILQNFKLEQPSQKSA